MLKSITLLGFLSLLSSLLQAEPTQGTCTNYFAPPLLKTDGSISTTLAVRALRHHAVVYETADSDKVVAQLDFGASLDPVKLSQDKRRIQVMPLDASQPLGWVATQDLLCAFTPLLNEKGIERKLFIKTPPSSEKDPQRVTAYPSPEATTCEAKQGEICKQLSRFELYFIFAEDPKTQRYLLADEYDITLGDKPLVGWVDQAKGISWNTVLGLRPQENILAYPTPVKTAKPEERIEIQGGKIWYDRSRIAERIPLLDIDKQTGFYHVAAAGIGIKGFEQLQDTQVLEQLKQVDIFFLLDGTASMGPYIQSATEAARTIVNTLRNDIHFRETSFRFGFRMYRDTFADDLNPLCQNGVCEGMPLLASTCYLDSNASYENWQDFDAKISQVQETTADNDDYPEQLFEGLIQTVQDIASCNKRTKLVFVIGDHGDRHTDLPPALSQALQQLKRLIIFFIQTPVTEARAQQPEYQAAYTRFQTQARALIAQIIPAEFRGKPIDRSHYLLTLDQAQLIEEIKNRVKSYSESAIVNEVAQQIRGGDALENIIDKWMAKGDMPVLYWQLLDETACQTLGEQCQKVIDHRVIDAYIPIDSPVEEEFRMTAIQLDEWRAILRRLNEVKIRPVEDQRNEFIRILRQEIQDILGKPPVYDEENKALAELMKRKAGLPMRVHSPLLQYGLQDIVKIPRCELRRLMTWVGAVHQVLNNVRSAPTLKVAFDLKPYPDNQCPLASDKGKSIAELTFHPPQKLGETEEYRYDRSFRGQVIYWLPTEFLP